MKYNISNMGSKEEFSSRISNALQEKLEEKTNGFGITLQKTPEYFVVEGVSPFPKSGRFKHREGYFINIKNNEIVKMKKNWSHSKAIVMDATRGGEIFGVKRKDIIKYINDLGLESMIDYLKKGEEFYSPDILAAAGRKGWVRVTMGTRGHADLQGRNFDDIASAMAVIMKTIPINDAMIEDYTGKYYNLRNKKEVNYFASTGTYKRIEIGDFI